jgi:hypothetical protein
MEVAHTTRKLCAKDWGGAAKISVAEKELETFIMACRKKSQKYSSSNFPFLPGCGRVAAIDQIDTADHGDSRPTVINQHTHFWISECTKDQFADPNDENRETLQKAKVGARARTTQGTDGRNVDLSHSLGIVLLIFSKTIDGWCNYYASTARLSHKLYKD